MTPQLLDLFTTAAKQHETMFAKRVREPPRAIMKTLYLAAAVTTRRSRSRVYRSDFCFKYNIRPLHLAVFERVFLGVRTSSPPRKKS